LLGAEAGGQGTEGDRRSTGVPCPPARIPLLSIIACLSEELLYIGGKGIRSPKTSSLFRCYPFHQPKSFRVTWHKMPQSNG